MCSISSQSSGSDLMLRGQILRGYWPRRATGWAVYRHPCQFPALLQHASRVTLHRPSRRTCARCLRLQNHLPGVPCAIGWRPGVSTRLRLERCCMSPVVPCHAVLADRCCLSQSVRRFSCWGAAQAAMSTPSNGSSLRGTAPGAIPIFRNSPSAPLGRSHRSSPPSPVMQRGASLSFRHSRPSSPSAVLKAKGGAGRFASHEARKSKEELTHADRPRTDRYPPDG